MEPVESQPETSNFSALAEKALEKGSSTDDTTPGPPTPNDSPNRYFIMKSLTKEDVAWSVVNKAWATQPHNESVLNEAFKVIHNPSTKSKRRPRKMCISFLVSIKAENSVDTLE